MSVKDEGTSAKYTERWQPFFDTLCRRGETSREDTAIFEQMTGLYTLAASIGVRLGMKSSVGKVNKSLKWQNFNEDTEVPVLKALAWSVSGRNVESIESARKILDLLEPYVEGGMEYLASDIFDDFVTTDGKLSIPRNTTPSLELLLLTRVQDLAAQAPL